MPGDKTEEKITSAAKEPDEFVAEAEPNIESNCRNGLNQKENYSMSPAKPQPEIGVTSVGEAIIKSTKEKCESGCGPVFVSTNNKIEQNYLKQYDQNTKCVR